MTGKNLTLAKNFLYTIQYTSDKITGWYAGNDGYWIGNSVPSKGSKSFVTSQSSFGNLSAKIWARQMIRIINSHGANLNNVKTKKPA